MKKVQKLIIVLFLIVSIVAPSVIAGNVAVAEAAAIKISKKTLSLDVGKSKTLKISGTDKKVTWTSSKKKVAIVSKNGKVTAKSTGVTIITASVSGKKYTCKVTVKKPTNPYLAKAPFNAMEINIENINLVVPKDWSSSIDDSIKGAYTITMAPDLDTNDSSIIINVTAVDETIKYSELKKELKKYYTAKNMRNILASSLEDDTLTISAFTHIDLKANNFTVSKVNYTISCFNDSVVIYQTIYSFYIDQFLVQMTVTDTVNEDMQTVAEYMINSIIIK